MVEPTERMQKVLDVINGGNTMDLFPVLKEWSTEELLALLTDVEAYHESGQVEIQKGWEESAFTLQNFFDPNAAKELDNARNHLRMLLMGMCSEICSVAFYYLNERGVNVEE
jgi:hypothetical protein